MNSATSTDRGTPGEAGFQPWHFFLLLSMVAATAAVILARNAHPAALLLLSAGVVASGLAGWAVFRAASGFFGLQRDVAPLAEDQVSLLEREKRLTLRAIKELEFDHAMGKVSGDDYADIGGHLRARALSLMQEIERSVAIPAPPVKVPAKSTARANVCANCQTTNDLDAKFCKSCGEKL